MSRDPILYLDDLVESAARIAAPIEGVDFARFQHDLAVHDAVLMNLLMIGEAAKHLPEALRAAAPEIDWRAIAGMRDLIAHQYFALDDHIVWDTACHHVPAVGVAARRIRADSLPHEDGT